MIQAANALHLSGKQLFQIPVAYPVLQFLFYLLSTIILLSFNSILNKLFLPSPSPPKKFYFPDYGNTTI